MDVMPKGMDDDAFNKEEQRINKAMMDLEDKEQQRWEKLNAQWERDNGL